MTGEIRATLSAAVLAASCLTFAVVSATDHKSPAAAVLSSPADETPSGHYSFERRTSSGQTIVRDGNGDVIAILTEGARTVLLAGSMRTFVDPRFTTAAVDTAAEVRLAPKPWTQGDESAPWFRPWLDSALRDLTPDVLAIAMQYSDGSPSMINEEGIRVGGDASFGPLSNTDGDGRDENSDFYDYLGISWAFPDGVHQEPDPHHYGAVDCSGYVRLVYGYRMGYPLLGSNTPGPGIPRRAYAISEFGPGVVIIPDRGDAATDYHLLQPGDLVFFDFDPEIDPKMDHSGIFLGLDRDGHHRFISSRSRADGPTLGDLGGTSLLDDGGYYSEAFRAARRL